MFGYRMKRKEFLAMIRTISMLSLLLILTAACAAQDAMADAVPKKSPDHMRAVELMKKVDVAAKAVNSAHYTAKSEGTEWLKSRLPMLEGEVWMVAATKDQPAKFRFDAEVRGKNGEEPRKIRLGSDGNVFHLIRYNEKKVHEDIDPSVIGQDGRLVQGLSMREYTHATPFSDEINGDVVELKGYERVGSEDCHVVHVIYNRGRGEAVWYVSKKDMLPRRVDRIITNPTTQEKGKQILTVTNLTVNSPIADDIFKTQVPDGFEKTDDFAPDHRQMQ